MSSQYAGNPANFAPALTPVAIVSSTNASPIVVTANAHGVLQGDYVFIQGHTVNTAANGLFQAGAVTANTLTLLVPVTLANTVGVGVGGATGYTQAWSAGATYQLPSDGDSFSAAGVNVGFNALGDRTAAEWCFQRPIRQGVIVDTALTQWIGGEAETWICNVLSASPRTVTLRHSTPVADGLGRIGIIPKKGYKIRVVMPNGNGNVMTFKREDATTLGNFTGATPGVIDFEYGGSGSAGQVSPSAPALAWYAVNATGIGTASLVIS